MHTIHHSSCGLVSWDPLYHPYHITTQHHNPQDCDYSS